MIHTLPNEHFPTHVVEIEKNGSYAILHTHNGVMLKVEAITDHVLRFRYSAKGYFSDDFSYAMDKDHRSGYWSIRFLLETCANNGYGLEVNL